MFAILVTGGCDKLSTGVQRTPIQFTGIDGIDVSTEGAYVVNWGYASGAEIESFSLYYQKIEEAEAGSLTTELTKAAFGVSIHSDKGILPAKTGQLLTILGADQNTFKTPTLDEGYYLFQVKALTKDGRIDENTSVYLLQVNPSILFRGLALATIEGPNLVMQWLPAPGIRENETFHYTIYRGPAFNSAVAYTKDTSFVYPLTNEIDGDVVHFGVRYTNGQNVEDQNSTLVAVTIPLFNKDYLGCVSGSAQSADRIKLNFEWPQSNTFTELRVYRNQKEVFSTTDRSVVSFIDRGLSEGQTYNYSCLAISPTANLSGTNVIRLGTLSTNPPTFAGIKNAAAESAKVALLSWGVSSGVPAKEFQVFATPGNTVNFGAEPSAKVGLSNLNTRVSDLGDDLPYSFGVRSCTALICDTNTEQISVVMPDNGAPTSVGATEIFIEQGKLKIRAPWTPAQGGVTKRHIFLKIDGAPSQAIGDYNLVRTVLITDPLIVSEFIYFDNPVAGKPHHVIVRDEDSHGNRSANFAIVSITTGDLNPPAFNGITALDIGAAGQEETTLKVTFTALDPSSISIGGAQTYRFYAREGGGASCSETYFKAEVPGSNYIAGTAIYTMTGLKAKTNYSVCVKVVDKFANISINANFLVRSTLDKTRPDFDGLQSLTFDAVNSLVKLSWNPSTSADINEYEIETWLTPSGLSSSIQTTIARRHADSPTGFDLTQLIIPFQSGDKLEVVVHACDNAASISGGTKNCKTFARSTALSVIFQDILPPPNFLGIAASGSQETPVQGRIIVHWIEPASWTDYSGFKVYKVNNDFSLTVMKDCPCSAANCPNHVSSCLLTDLDHYRTYRLHVRAYDAVGNYTLLDPQVSVADVRTTDETAPVFTSNLGLLYASGAASLSWSAATDNQYASEPDAAIRYRVYRKATSNFANLLEPWVGGTLIAEQQTLTYADIGNFVSGSTYYYTVCAVDASENTNCDGNYKTVVIPDLTPPILVSFTSNKTTAGKSWALSWSATDNINSPAELLYRVKYRLSSDPDAVLNDSDTTLFTQIGALSLPSLTGPINTDTYIHYLLTVSDAAGNTAKKQVTVYSQNKVEILSVKASEGSVAGGKIIYVVGKGFHSSSLVSIGGTACGSLQILSAEHILCRSPAKALGTYSLTVTNTDTSSASFANAYSACTPDVNCTQICNNPASWQTPFAINTGRGSTESAPFIVCDATQLAALGTQASGFFYKLADNIDLSSYTGNSWTGLTTPGNGDNFIGFVDGDGYAVVNLTYNNAANTVPFGLFRRPYGASRISRLSVLNANITSGNYTGILAGASDYNTNLIFEDIVVQGSVLGKDYVGGVGGELRGNLYRAKAYTTVSGLSNVGGVAGIKLLASSDIEWRGTVTGTSVNGVNVGGIYGQYSGNNSVASNLFSHGTVTNLGANTYRTAGIAGQFVDMTIKNSVFDGTVDGSIYTGGIGGASANVIFENITTRGTVTGSVAVGGISGWSRRVTAINVANYANVTNAGDQTGGLFGWVEGSVTEPNVIRDASRNYGTVTGHQDTGGLAGVVRWLSIYSSRNEGNVSGNGSVGGVLGWNTGVSNIVIDQTYNTGKVYGLYDNVGGLIGGVDGSKVNLITKSFSTGEVEGRSLVGGLIGRFQGTLQQSYATGKVTAREYVAGGLIGQVITPAEAHSSLIETSYATGDVYGGTLTFGDKYGGFIGVLDSRGTVRKNFSLGKVNGFDWVGGFLGAIRGNGNLVEMNYSRGEVTGRGTFTGGFIGVACESSTALADCTVRNNYSRSNVHANNRAGGFTGWARMGISTNYSTGRVERISSEAQFGPFVGEISSPVTFTNNFWDKTTSARATTAGSAAVGKTTTEMKDPNTFSSWDNTVWLFSAGNYPKFIWEVTP
ncbi:MAG: IPT/TIG domain-containing protein [Bdellovibrionota bacterium]